MDVEKLEKLAELRDKGALTQEEFDAEKKKLLNLDLETSNTDNKANISDNNEIHELTFNDKLYDWWHKNGIVTIMIVVILGFIILVNSGDGEMELIHWIMLFGISSIIGAGIKEYQKTSKIVNDLHRYANINEVISRYGTPDNIENYGDYTKYTFKRSTNGWGWFKYQVDIFTMQKGKIIKHENFYEK